MLRRRYECPVCGRRLRGFATYAGREGARCPRCGSLERHRHLWLYLERECGVGCGPLRLLHVAPDGGIDARLRRTPQLDYVSGDLEGERGGSVIDLCALEFGDEHFDAAIVFHVLEHVPDDALALRELRRVLRPGGWALLQVPFREGSTVEEPAVLDPEERRARFGQSDHVRMYGEDFPARVRAAGFEVQRVEYREAIDPSERERFGLRYFEFWRATAA